MRFGEKLQNQKVPEWKDSYFNYYLLKKLLTPFKIKRKMLVSGQIEEQRQLIKFKTLKDQQIKYLKEFNQSFEKIILGELDKVNAFFQFKLTDITKKWKDIQNDARLQSLDKKIKGFEQKSKILLLEEEKSLKIQFEIFFKELVLFEQYVELNETALKKITKKAAKNLEPKQFDEIFFRVNQRNYDSPMQRNKEKIKEIQNESEDVYINSFFGKHIKLQKQGKKKLRQISEIKGISQRDNFIFGLFFGFSVLLLGWILILFIRGVLEVEEQEDQQSGGYQFSYVFPMFRGAALFIIMYWLLAFNIYGWNKYHINYKLIFKFSPHFSQITEVLRRAAVFTSIYLIFFIWYILVQYKRSVLLPALDWFPPQYCPIVVWIVLFVYHVIPIKKFNFQGRKYMWNLIKISFIEPFDKRKKMEFRISWLTDQLTSLVGPFKDFEYTMCYYIYDVQKHNSIVSYTCPHGERPTAFILSIVPLFLRAAQCLKQAYDDGYYKGNPIIINFFKYFSSILASILSYLVKLSKDDSANNEADKSLLVSWIIMAAITTLYSYSWDLKKDWGFLEPGQKGLRKHLMYEKKRYYYIAMLNNLILRCVWVFSISPDIIGIFGVPSHTFNFFVYFFEAIRRCQWNFFRVEKEHIVNYLKYRAVLDLHLVPVAKSMTENLSQSQNSKQSHEFQQLDSEENYSIDKRNIDVNLSEENDNLKQIQENNFQYYRLIQKEQNEGFQTSQLLRSLKQFKKNIYKQGQTYYQIYDKDKEKQD